MQHFLTGTTDTSSTHTVFIWVLFTRLWHRPYVLFCSQIDKIVWFTVSGTILLTFAVFLRHENENEGRDDGKFIDWFSKREKNLLILCHTFQMWDKDDPNHLQRLQLTKNSVKLSKNCCQRWNSIILSNTWWVNVKLFERKNYKIIFGRANCFSDSAHTLSSAFSSSFRFFMCQVDIWDSYLGYAVHNWAHVCIICPVLLFVHMIIIHCPLALESHSSSEKRYQHLVSLAYQCFIYARSYKINH